MGECTMLNTNGQEEQVRETDRTKKERVFYSANRNRNRNHKLSLIRRRAIFTKNRTKVVPTNKMQDCILEHEEEEEENNSYITINIINTVQ